MLYQLSYSRGTLLAALTAFKHPEDADVPPAC
jgi:hypothetical protein